jgi:transketolase
MIDLNERNSPRMSKTEISHFASRLRANVVRTIHKAKASHIGSNLSAADIMAVLFGSELRFRPEQPDWEERDRFILSKGHAAVILYATLAELGFFPKEHLFTYSDNGSPLLGHASHHVPGVELSTGSLGHGLPVGTGLALAAKADHKTWRVYVLLSDGELDEGSNWEALLFAAHHKLDNLVAIVDYNKIQSYGRVADVLGLEPLGAKFKAFNWNVIEVDGHSISALLDALSRIPNGNRQPTILICHTVKGKGVSFMEDSLAWHYRNPSDEDLMNALRELALE